MENAKVFISEKAERSLKKLPNYIVDMFDSWVRLIEDHGYLEMKRVPGYRDHALKGKLKGKRSSSLNRSYRVIYILTEDRNLIVKVFEINNHDYKI